MKIIHTVVNNNFLLQSLNIQIKWPNDIFIGKNFDKLGGILATSSICGNYASVNLG